VLRALASCPRCLPQLAQHAIPVLTQVVERPQGQPPMLVEASLNLLDALCQPHAPEVAAAVARASLAPAAALLGATDDASEASAAAGLLVQLVSRPTGGAAASGALGAWRGRKARAPAQSRHH
jgi:hypothetical protein